MNVWVIIGLVVSGSVILLLLMAALPQRKPHELTREGVAGEIEAFLSGSGGAQDWSDFCTFNLADPELDEIRARCARLREEFPPGASGGYCNEEGMEVLRGYVLYLRRL
jgi:hypothetical protein